MKEFLTINFDAVQCRGELDRLQALLLSKEELSERHDLLPLFVDWFFSFDDHKNSAGFTKNFGYGHIEFFGLLLIGRSGHLSEHERTRLRWRSDRVSVNTHRIYCRTFDDLYDDLNNDWRLLSLDSQKKNGPGIVGES
jgi:hypothetical protein